MVTLERVEIPGYAEACRREARVRDTAFLGGNEIVCGVTVAPISLRRIIWLEQAHNGYLVPWRFDSEDEMLAHALQILYFCRPDFMPPESPKFSLWNSFTEGMRRDAFFRTAMRSRSASIIIKEIEDWFGDALMDSPAGGGQSEVPAPSFASWPAYIVDKFAETGLTFTYHEIMDMPLRRLWQHWRVAVGRINDAKLTNPSDQVAVEYLAKK